MPLIDARPDALAETYARAIFDLAEQQGGRGLIEQLLGELEDILELARENPRFGEFLASRILAKPKRDAALQRLLSHRASPLTLRVLRLLNDKDRLGHLPPIVAAFDRLAQERFGRVEVDIVTASAIDPDALASVKARLSTALGGRDVIAHTYTDPALIGGMQLRIGDQFIDASVASRLRQMASRVRDRGSQTVKGRAGDILR